MGTWHTRGLRGSTLEDMVNRTNERYLEQELALIQKIPTPITPVRMDKDAKECNADTFPLQNIHEHQIIFMENLEKQQGISFLLIYYTARNEMYYMRFEEVAKFWNRAMTGGRKSIRLEELDPRFFFDIRSGCFVPYLDMINLDLELRDERS